MSNEDKIVDSLAQLVIRADRHEMLLEKLVEGQLRHEQLLREHSEKLDLHSAKLDVHSEKLDAHSAKLDEHTRILNVHTRILEEQTRLLGEHARILGEHTVILNVHTDKLDEQDHRLQNLERLSARQEALLERILELLAEDVIRAEEILDAEYFDDGKRVVFHKSKYAPNF